MPLFSATTDDGAPLTHIDPARGISGTRRDPRSGNTSHRPRAATAHIDEANAWHFDGETLSHIGHSAALASDSLAFALAMVNAARRGRSVASSFELRRACTRASIACRGFRSRVVALSRPMNFD